MHGELIPVSRFFVTPGNTLEHLVNWVQSQYLLFDTYPETESEYMAWIEQNSSPLITEVYNDFRGKLLRNISSQYGNRFDLFSLDDEGKPILQTFKSESYQVFINGELILEKQGEVTVIRLTLEKIELMQKAINFPELIKDEVKIVSNNKIVYWLKNSKICVNIINK